MSLVALDLIEFGVKEREMHASSFWTRKTTIHKWVSCRADGLARLDESRRCKIVSCSHKTVVVKAFKVFRSV